MSLIKKLSPHLADENQIKDLIAPPYDIVNHAQVQSYLKEHPDSIMNVTRPDGLFNKTIDVKVLQKGYQMALKALKETQKKSYKKHPKSCFLIYQISGKNLKQTGLVSLANTETLQTHELTRKTKVEDRISLSQIINCQISPVMLCTDSNAKLGNFLNSKIASKKPMYCVKYENYNHDLFLVDSPSECLEIEKFFSDDQKIYITDGHHRSQTQLTLHQRQPKKFSKHILSVIFPGEDLKILGYHRLVKRPESSSLENFWLDVGINFNITKLDTAFLPVKENEFGCFIENQWFKFTYKNKIGLQLSIDILHNMLIKPYFKVTNPKEDPNIDFIGGLEATNQMESICLKQPNWVGFTLAPTTIEQIIQTANAKKIMPPKSTYFEPKLLDGFLLQEEALSK